MNFSLKSKVKKPSVSADAAKDLFGPDEDSVTAVPQASTDKPIDYLLLKTEMAKSFSQHPAESNLVLVEEDEAKQRQALLRRRDEAMGQFKQSNSSSSKSTIDMKQAGLVVIGSGPVGERGEAKHIARMKETAEVNEKFKNLLKIKVAEREKDKAEAEFGERPEEIVTKAYLKQKEESLRLERELQAGESSKRDVSKMFREMLDSGHYARTNYVEESTSKTSEKSLLERIKLPEPERVDVSAEQVKKVLEKIVPEATKETARAVQEQAKIEASKIIEQLQRLDAGADEEGDREQARLSARERFLQRKKQRIEED
jgi:hypothetical protein